MRAALLLPALTGLLLALAPAARAEGPLTVQRSEVEDLKAVIATVEPLRELVARTRIAGTIISLTVREGDLVEAGAEIALVADRKLTLQMQALDSRIRSVQAERDQAKTDFDRIEALFERGVVAQARLDQTRTALDVAERNLAAIRADREVVVQQAAEGAVLAPGAGRVLDVPVSEGRVVLAGETVARLAAEDYILRLQLPERHARFLRAGATVQIAARGLNQEASERRLSGTVRLVYPEIEGGRVIADVEVAGLGDYFVGERTRVYVPTGTRETILVPADYLFSRAGVTFARLEDGASVPVQPGETRPEGVEILSGLKPGDVLVAP